MRSLIKLLQCLVCWRVPIASPADLAKGQVILTQAVEYDRDGSPGPGNDILAHVAVFTARDTGLKVIPQYELLAANPCLPCAVVVGLTKMKTLFGERPAHTAAVCREQAEFCRKHGWTRVLVVTFPDHHWRTVACYRKLGLEPIVVRMPSHQDAQYYSSSAKRWHMRWRWTFRRFDVLARLAYWWAGDL